MSMSRRQKKDAARAGARAVDQQRDAADALHREHGTSDRMRMPHERDESAVENAQLSEKSPEQRDIIARARKDLESGQQDTDCRSQPNDSPACPGDGGKRP